MTWIAGVDGCRAGWFRVAFEPDTQALGFRIVAHAHELMTRPPEPSVIGIDMPIGLPECGRRDCDAQARARLGPRRSSVFPAPIRGAVGAVTREEASRITFDADGRKVAAQAFGIYPKIAQLDELLRCDPEARERFVEVHPELSFTAWNGGSPLTASKKSPTGRRSRLALAEEWLGTDVLQRARGTAPKKDLTDDDILDAIAVAWTALRIHRGEAETLPAVPPRDACGLPMRIVF